MIAQVLSVGIFFGPTIGVRAVQFDAKKSSGKISLMGKLGFLLHSKMLSFSGKREGKAETNGKSAKTDLCSKSYVEAIVSVSGDNSRQRGITANGVPGDWFQSQTVIGRPVYAPAGQGTQGVSDPREMKPLVMTQLVRNWCAGEMKSLSETDPIFALKMLGILRPGCDPCFGPDDWKDLQLEFLLQIVADFAKKAGVQAGVRYDQKNSLNAFKQTDAAEFQTNALKILRSIPSRDQDTEGYHKQGVVLRKFYDEGLTYRKMVAQSCCGRLGDEILKFFAKHDMSGKFQVKKDPVEIYEIPRE